MHIPFVKEMAKSMICYMFEKPTILFLSKCKILGAQCQMSLDCLNIYLIHSVVYDLWKKYMEGVTDERSEEPPTF